MGWQTCVMMGFLACPLMGYHTLPMTTCHAHPRHDSMPAPQWDAILATKGWDAPLAVDAPNHYYPMSMAMWELQLSLTTKVGADDLTHSALIPKRLNLNQFVSF